MVGNWPASVGLGPDEDNDLRALVQLVATRCQWVDSICGMFNILEREQPGRVYSLPERNIYDGMTRTSRRCEVWTRAWRSSIVGRLDGADKSKLCVSTCDGR